MLVGQVCLWAVVGLFVMALMHREAATVLHAGALMGSLDHVTPHWIMSHPICCPPCRLVLEALCSVAMEQEELLPQLLECDALGPLEGG